MSHLRDGAIVGAKKTVDSIQVSVGKVERTSDVVNSTTKATLREVHSLRSDYKEARDKNEQSTDLQRAIDEAKKAMKIVLKEKVKTAQCKRFLSAFDSCAC